jgi:hypothetical protein
MATKTFTGEKNPDGSPRFHFDWRNDPDFLGAILFTGPISGTISLSDGAAYDVTDDIIQCKPEHVGPLQHHIHLRHVAAGREGIPPHVCTDDCGAERV